MLSDRKSERAIYQVERLKSLKWQLPVELLGRYSSWTYWVDRTCSLQQYVTKQPYTPAVKRGTVRKLRSEEVAVLVERYSSGATMIELAKQFKIHRTTVSAHLRRAGVGTR